MVRSVVIMGPSGNGKSTLAKALAERLGWDFIEGDAHHPPANIAKMARAEPLTDSDRQPFLDSIARALAATDGGVAACSALRKTYRERLTLGAGGALMFVLPQVPARELERRISGRADHFMPPSLLSSQLATLEMPDADENHMIVDGTLPADVLAAAIAGQIARKNSE